MARHRGENPHEHEAGVSEEPICQPPRSGWELGHSEQWWILLRALLTQRRIHWLDGFVILDEWQTGKQQGPYPQLFAALVAKAKRPLRDSHIDNAEIHKLSRRRRFWQLLWHPSQTIESRVVEGVRLAEEASKAFCNDDLSGWNLLQEAQHKWLDPTSISEAVVLAPGPPDHTAAYSACLGTIAELLHERQRSLVMAFDRVSDLICQPRSKSGVTFKAAEDVFPRWVDELFCVQEALKRLEGYDLPTLGATDQLLNEFVGLVNNYYDSYEDVLGGKRRRDTVQQEIAEKEMDRALTRLHECQVMTEAIEVTVQYFEELRYKRISQEDVRDSRDDAIEELVRNEGFPIRVRHTVVGRLCMCLRKCAERRRRGREFTNIWNDEASTYAAKRQRVMGVLAALEGKPMPRALTRPIARGLAKVAGDEEEDLSPTGSERDSRFKYLKSIQRVLSIASEPEWFRKMGPELVDFEDGWVYERPQAFGELRDRVMANSATLLEGESATGKTILARTLAYRFHKDEQVPTFYFKPYSGVPFDSYELAREINTEAGVFILDDCHIANRMFQAVYSSLEPSPDRHVLFVARPPFRKFLSDQRIWNPSEKECLTLEPFDDVEAIIEHSVRYSKNDYPNLIWSEEIKEALREESRGSFWLLAYAIKGCAHAEGNGDTAQWIRQEVKLDLRCLEEIDSPDEPYAYQYPKILVTLSPLYKNEVLTEQGYLLKEGFGFNEQALGALARHGEITRRRTSQGHVFYGLPHSALAKAYWEHGMEYRNSLGLPEYESFIYAYAVSDVCNGLEAVDSGKPDERVNVLRRLYETGDIVGVVEREESLSRITLWVTDTGRKPHLAKALRRQELLEVIARKLDESEDIETQVECICELSLTDALAGQTLWSLIDRPQFASKLIEIDNVLYALLRLLDVDREAGWDLWELLDIERLAAKKHREYWSDDMALSVFMICDADREIGLRLLTHLDLKLLASSLGRADTVLDIYLGLESLCYASSFAAEEVCRMLDLDLIAGRLTNEDDQQSACKCIQIIWDLDQACCLQLMSLVENNNLVQSMKNILCSRPTGD